MRRLGWGLGLALAAVAGLFGTAAGADDKANPLEAYEKAARPGPQHKTLEVMAGSWTFTTKFWLEPGKEPQTSRGTAERKMIMGGRFLQDEVAGEMFGKPFLGHGLTGYDNSQGKYVGSWVDNFGTGIAHSVGTADESGKVLTFEREDYDPAAKQKVKSRDVIRLLGPDKQVMEMYKVLPDGKALKTMEIVFIRKGAKSGQ
jgi:hypothetical protein